ncbi:PASTA domain-containing protein [Planosporangium mesophilum]|uniref:PASTA domain-containing protein n=1 Tax=Planosporangium mesophilum TaxID=689768 RepID=UPI00194F349D|nr:PASTA domain-containing protein [Planosporangium mesophilum]
MDEPTSTFNPFDDDSDDDSDADESRTVPLDADATRPVASNGPADETRPMTLADETRPMTPADADATRRVTPQIWAARAPVPVPDAVPAPAPVGWREESAEAEPPGFWARPAVIALIVVILLAMLGTGLWLIFSGLGRPSVSTPATSATPSAAPAPTETASQPESQAESPAPSATATGRVAVPDVVGQSEAAAREQLTAVGLTYTVTRRPVAGVSPGTVAATEPAAGTMVSAGSRVTLVVASAPTPAATTGTRTQTPTRPPTTQPTPPASRPAGGGA